MTCTNNHWNRSIGLSTCPEPIKLIPYLKNLFFTQTQIRWILFELDKITEFKWFEVESIAEFPVNHDYGFTDDGDSIEGSKWNLKIGIRHEDLKNKWTGKQSSFILLIKNEQ